MFGRDISVNPLSWLSLLVFVGALFEGSNLSFTWDSVSGLFFARSSRVPFMWSLVFFVRGIRGNY